MAHSPLRKDSLGPSAPVPRSGKFGSGAHAVSRARIPLLVVDADPRVHHAVSMALLGGFEVHSALLLIEAAPLVEIKRPRVVLLSTEFDPLGLLLFGRFMHQEFRGTVLIGSTRAGHAKDAMRAMDLGARGIIEKPVDAGRLITTLAKHFG